MHCTSLSNRHHYMTIIPSHDKAQLVKDLTGKFKMTKKTSNKTIQYLVYMLFVLVDSVLIVAITIRTLVAFTAAEHHCLFGPTYSKTSQESLTIP